MEVKRGWEYFRHGEAIVIIENVPAWVCNKCDTVGEFMWAALNCDISPQKVHFKPGVAVLAARSVLI